MQTIYKYLFSMGDEVSFSIPLVRWLHAAPAPSLEGDRRSFFNIWGIVDTDAEEKFHKIYIRGTGHPFRGNEGRHISTMILQDGALVFHIFASSETEEGFSGANPG